MAYATDTADRRRRRAFRSITPLAALLVAAILIWQGSNAAFSAQTYNTGDAWETGNMSLTNNGGGSVFSQSTSVLFNETTRKPGDTGVKCITVRSGGSLPGSLRLFRSPLSGTLNFNALAGWINLTIDAQPVADTVNVDATCGGYGGGTSGAAYNGTLFSMPQTYAAATGTAITGGAQRVVYRIAWAINGVADNSVQSTRVVTDLTWEVQ